MMGYGRVFQAVDKGRISVSRVRRLGTADSWSPVLAASSLTTPAHADRPIDYDLIYFF